MRLRHLLPVSALGLVLALPAKAVCPVCTIAVCAGLGLSRWLGIDDTVSGVWIGGVTFSLIAWTKSWLDRKRIRFPGRPILIAAAYYALVLGPLFWLDIIGHPQNVLWGMDKLLLGTLFGSVGFALAASLYEPLKRRNGGKPHFPFQKVAMPVGALVILSLFFYFLTRT